MNKRTLLPVCILFLFLILAAALLANDFVARPAVDVLLPTKGWTTATPASVGMDENVSRDCSQSLLRE